jgi:hypothetical protein
MTAPPAFFPLAILADQIAALCAQRQTGNLVLISDDNRMAQMHLLGGLIMSIVCRGRRGRDALPLMRTMANARMSLDKNALVRNEGVAFSPAAVLAYLKGTTQQLPEPEAGSVAVTNEEPKKGIAPDVRLLLQAALVRYIGPMAEIVCDEHFGAAQDLRALAAALAAEIPGKDQRSAFKADIAKALGIADL